MGIDELELSIVTPEVGPLAIFGSAAGDAVAGLLERAGITVYLSAVAQVLAAGHDRAAPGGRAAPGQDDRDSSHRRPRDSGPGGGGAHGFIPIDSACWVPGADAFTRAGDAAAYPIRHGGLGSPDGRHRSSVDRAARPEQRSISSHSCRSSAKLLSGGAPLYLRRTARRPARFESEVYDTPPWPEDQKVVAEELGPYLAGSTSDHRALRGVRC